MFTYVISAISSFVTGGCQIALGIFINKKNNDKNTDPGTYKNMFYVILVI
jgi:hypothetical protein